MAARPRGSEFGQQYDQTESEAAKLDNSHSAHHSENTEANSKSADTDSVWHEDDSIEQKEGQTNPTAIADSGMLPQVHHESLMISNKMI